MQSDPSEVWRRLTEEYRDMSEEELRNLAEDFDDLTENAKQALRQEMRSRGLGDPETASAPDESQFAHRPSSNAPPQRASCPPEFDEVGIFPTDSHLGDLGRSPKLVPDEADAGSGDTAGEPREYTWKTVLCECETDHEAQYLANALRNAGLDGWVQPSREFGRQYSRVLVAADQLEQAKAIAAKPIPQEIIDDSKAEVPEFVVPKCPKCGAEDPILEAVEPTNTWRCEQCDYQWSDPAAVAVDNPARDSQPSS